MAPNISPALSVSLPLLASCTSLLAVSYMYFSLKRLPQGRGQKLLARQLQYLACAEIVYAAFEVIHGLLDLSVIAGIFTPGTEGDHICEGIYALTGLGNMTSILFECHLALAFVASTSKSPRTLNVLSRQMPLTWALGVLLAIASVATSSPIWNPRDTSYACRHAGRMWVQLLASLTVFILCLVAYTVSTCYVLTAGEIVKNSVAVRASTYVFLALVFMAPMTIYNASGNVFLGKELDLVVYMICKTLYNLNGVLNFAMYSLQCRQARQLRSGSHDGQRQSKSEHMFSVNFRSGDSFQQPPLESSETASFDEWFEWRHSNASFDEFANANSGRFEEVGEAS